MMAAWSLALETLDGKPMPVRRLILTSVADVDLVRSPIILPVTIAFSKLSRRIWKSIEKRSGTLVDEG